MELGFFMRFSLLHSGPVGFFPLPCIYFILNLKMFSNGESKRNPLSNGCLKAFIYGRTDSFGTFFLCVWRILCPLCILTCLLQDIPLISVLHLGLSFNLLNFIIQGDAFIIYVGDDWLFPPMFFIGCFNYIYKRFFSHVVSQFPHRCVCNQRHI